jgi:hypothetical protein
MSRLILIATAAAIVVGYVSMIVWLAHALMWAAGYLL